MATPGKGVDPRARGPRSAIKGLLFLAGVLTLGGCGDDATAPEIQEPAPLSASPATGSPGQVVELKGLDAAAIPSGSEARVDGETAPLFITADGDVAIAVPMTAAGPGGNAPPAHLVDVEVVHDGVLFGTGTGVLAIEAVPEAPGTTDMLRMEFGNLAGELTRISDLIHEESEAEAIAMAVTDAIDELVNGDSPQSLTGQLSKLSPEEVALLDGFLSSSGVLAGTRDLVGSLAAIGMGDVAESGDLATRSMVLTDDVSLARRMQFQLVARALGETVVNETAQTYANTVGLAAGAAAVAVAVPGAAVVAATLAVIDFAVNKVLIGLLPSAIDGFTLTLEDTTLGFDELTAAKVEIVASNTPPPVGIQDFVGITLNFLGLGGGAAPSLEEFFQNTAAFFITTIQQGLASYAAAHPELNLDVSFAVVPQMTWEAVIHDPRLVDRVSLNPQVVVGANDLVEWRSSETTPGEAPVYARTASGPESMLIDLPSGFAYTGGAFGEDSAVTSTITLFVASGLVMEVDFASTIEPGGINALEVKAGYLSASADPVWSAGLDVELLVDGGQVEESSGVTDGDGQFITLAQLLPESDEIIITVTVSDDYGQQVVKSVTASVSAAGNVEILDGHIEVIGGVRGYVGAYGPGYSPMDFADSGRDRRDYNSEGSYAATWSGGGGISHSETGDQAQYSALVEAEVSIETFESGEVAALIQGSATMSATAISSGADGQHSAGGNATVQTLIVRFAVDEGDLEYEFTSDFTETPRQLLVGDDYYYNLNSSEEDFSAPQLTGAMDEGEYMIWIDFIRCSAASPEGSDGCTNTFAFTMTLKR